MQYDNTHNIRGDKVHNILMREQMEATRSRESSRIRLNLNIRADVRAKAEALAMEDDRSLTNWLEQLIDNEDRRRAKLKRRQREAK
jgi:predicted HicB family RNase H-like nuclease